MSGADTLGAWRDRMAAAPVADPARLIGDGALVVLSPHPDDETIGCSALLLAAGRLGQGVGLVALTDGDASHPNSKLFPPARLAAIRAAEQREAVERLGCDAAEWLRLALPDGASGRDARFGAAVDEAAALCERLGATALAAPHPDDPHPDHHAAAAMALEIRRRRPGLRILFYEVWSRRLARDAPFRQGDLTPFRLRTDVAAKRAALDRHSSQLGRVVGDDPGGFVLPDWFLRAQDDPLEVVSWLAMPGALPEPEHFARLYAGGGDPWHVRSSPYEIGKREAAVRLLAGRRHRRALEAGCGEGHLTAALVREGIAEEAVGFDREPVIVRRAAAMGWGERVRFEVGSMPDGMPEGRFDLAVLSEVLYFLDEEKLQALARNLAKRLEPGATLLVVSYLGPTDTPLGGREASDLFLACLGERAVPVSSLQTTDYRIHRLEWRPERAEARADAGADPNGAGAGGRGED